jgi:hypothetical protein
MAVVMGIALVLVALVVREDGDTGAAPVRQESLWQSLAGIRAALATDSVGLLFLAHMTAYSSFVLIAGLWGGPYLSHVYGLGLTERGNLLLVPAITQVVGMVIWGRADRLFGSYKVPVLIGAGTTCALLWFLALAGQRPLPALVAAGDVRLLRRLHAAGGRPWQVVVPAASRRPRHDAAQHGQHGRRVRVADRDGVGDRSVPGRGPVSPRSRPIGWCSPCRPRACLPPASPISGRAILCPQARTGSRAIGGIRSAPLAFCATH